MVNKKLPTGKAGFAGDSWAFPKLEKLQLGGYRHPAQISTPCLREAVLSCRRSSDALRICQSSKCLQEIDMSFHDSSVFAESLISGKWPNLRVLCMDSQFVKPESDPEGKVISSLATPRLALRDVTCTVKEPRQIVKRWKRHQSTTTDSTHTSPSLASLSGPFHRLRNGCVTNLAKSEKVGMTTAILP